MLPTRKLQRKYSSLSGRIPSRKTNRNHFFESSLERDFETILEFDPFVIEYLEQPIKIQYSFNGKIRYYHPDFLVTFNETNLNVRPSLYEVKYSATYEKNRLELEPKYNAATAYAKTKGWDFHVVTEREIRTTYLENSRFLLNYRDYEYSNIEDFELLLSTINELSHTTPEELILIAARDRNKRMELIYLLWHMIANYYIACDLNNKLSMDSEIWPTTIF